MWPLLMQWLSSKCYTNFLHLLTGQIWGCNASRKGLHELVTLAFISETFSCFWKKLVWKLTPPMAWSKCIFIIFMTTVKVILFGWPLFLCFWNWMILFCTIRRKYFCTPKNSIACGWIIFQVWPPTHTPHYNASCLWPISWLTIWKIWIKWLVSLLFSNQ